MIPFVSPSTIPLFQLHLLEKDIYSDNHNCDEDEVIYWFKIILFLFWWGSTFFLTKVFTSVNLFMSRCTVIRTFLAIFPTTPKSYATFFWGYRGPHIGPTNTNHTKNFKKSWCLSLFGDVLSLGWGGMGVLWCKRLNYSLQMGQIWLIMTQNDWLWLRMTYHGSWGH